MKFFLFFRLLRESYLFAINALVVNKLRTILSLLGITIGIFSIISVFTIVDSMEKEIRGSIESLGNNVLFVQKWPWTFSSDYAWWKYINRPLPNMDDVNSIKRKSSGAANVAFSVNTLETVEHMSSSIQNVIVQGVSEDYDKAMNVKIADGHFFTLLESAGGKNVAIIGSEIAENLYPGQNPLGKKIKIYGRNQQIVGLLKKEGEDMFGNKPDRLIMLPVNYVRTIIDVRSDAADPVIIVRSLPGISNEELKDELTGILRSEHRLRPTTEDDFSINETSLLTQGFQGVFSVISAIVWIIGGFSILVGGFGIANIMFVTVKERTTMIGIQKSIGAKRYFILFQFLFEAIILSLIGGAVGLIIVYVGTLIISAWFDMDLYISMGNIIRGLVTSAIIGLISGIIPAYTASKLNPVDAIRANQ